MHLTLSQRTALNWQTVSEIALISLHVPLGKRKMRGVRNKRRVMVKFTIISEYSKSTKLFEVDKFDFSDHSCCVRLEMSRWYHFHHLTGAQRQHEQNTGWKQKAGTDGNPRVSHESSTVLLCQKSCKNVNSNLLHARHTGSKGFCQTCQIL